MSPEKKLSLGPSRYNVLLALVLGLPLWDGRNPLRHCLKSEHEVVHQVCSGFENLCSSRTFGAKFT